MDDMIFHIVKSGDVSNIILAQFTTFLNF